MAWTVEEYAFDTDQAMFQQLLLENYLSLDESCANVANLAGPQPERLSQVQDPRAEIQGQIPLGSPSPSPPAGTGSEYCNSMLETIVNDHLEAATLRAPPSQGHQIRDCSFVPVKVDKFRGDSSPRRHCGGANRKYRRNSDPDPWVQPDVNSFMIKKAKFGQDHGLGATDVDAESTPWSGLLSSIPSSIIAPEAFYSRASLNVFDFPNSGPDFLVSSMDRPRHLGQDLEETEEYERICAFSPIAMSASNVENGAYASDCTPAAQEFEFWVNRQSESTLRTSPFLQECSSSEFMFQHCHAPDPHPTGFQLHGAPHLEINTPEESSRVRLVEMLQQVAESVEGPGRDIRRARVILARLQKLVSRRKSTMERVAAFFCEGLQYKVDGVKKLNLRVPHDSLDALHVLWQSSPYIRFGYFAANKAILEAFRGEPRVHIIDYDILEGIQLADLIEGLACRPEQAPHLRVTAICRSHDQVRRNSDIETVGQRLAELAELKGIPFSFRQVRIDNEEQLRPALLKRNKGECLAVNCMVHLPHMTHRSKTAVACFLRTARKLSPKVLTFAGEELSCSSRSFASHFFEAFYHYSALSDSLESLCPYNLLVERNFLGPRIAAGLISSCHSESDGDHWHRLPQTEGFHPIRPSENCLSEANQLLDNFSRSSSGYKVEEGNQRLLLSWRSKALLGASIWRPLSRSKRATRELL